jgi:hypothetical protein
MLYKSNLVTFLIITFSCYTPAHHTLSETTLSTSDLDSCLVPNYTAFYPELNNLPADITFGLADLKYNHGSFKIIECGNAQYCGLKPHPIIINGKKHIQCTPFWEIIEHLLKQYQLPVWFAGLPPYQPFPLFLQTNTARSQHYMPDLINNPAFKATARTSKPALIKDHANIIIFRAKNRFKQIDPELAAFEQAHPGSLLVNSKSTPYFFSKEATYKLFQDAGIAHVIPDHALYSVGYTPTLAAQIIQDLAPHQRFVIKPLNQSRAIGVSFVTAEELDTHLKHLFGTGLVQPHEKKSVGYWRTSKDTHFLISEFVPSQKIVHNNLTYEPTMRIIFYLTHEAGNIAVNIIGGCWKNPPCALGAANAQNATEQHITNPDRHETDDGIMIAPEELAAMKAVVAPVLAKAYKTLLLY